METSDNDRQMRFHISYILFLGALAISLSAKCSGQVLLPYYLRQYTFAIFLISM